MQRCPDISRAKALLDGWEPKVPLDAGLARTIDYFDRLLTEGGEKVQRAPVLQKA
jgi:UDP-glucuronate decarboxylase